MITTSPITRSRAIKFLLAAPVLLLYRTPASEALTPRQRRRRRRLRRQKNITAEWRSVDFLAVTVGSEAETAIQFFNSGERNVRVKASVSGTGFYLEDGTEFIIGADQGTWVTVTFRPTGPGAHTGTLDIRAARDNLLLERVSLSGRGDEP